MGSERRAGWCWRHSNAIGYIGLPAPVSRPGTLEPTLTDAEAWDLALSAEPMMMAVCAEAADLDFDALHRDCLEALHKAALRFDPAKYPTSSFTNYARHRVHAVVRDHRLKSRPTASRYAQDIVREVDSTTRYLSARNRPHSVKDVADFLGYSLETVQRARSQLAVRWVNTSDGPVAAETSAEHDIIRAEDQRRAMQALQGLSDIEQQVVRQHVGMDDAPMSFAAIAKAHGKSKAWAYKVYHAAVCHLARSVDDGAAPYYYNVN